MLVYNKVVPSHPVFYRMFDFESEGASELD
jgi:hypothetical protein